MPPRQMGTLKRTTPTGAPIADRCDDTQQGIQQLCGQTTPGNFHRKRKLGLDRNGGDHPVEKPRRHADKLLDRRHVNRL